MKALVGAFNQEKALVGAFSAIVQPVVEPMEHYTALVTTENIQNPGLHQAATVEGNCPVFICTTISQYIGCWARCGRRWSLARVTCVDCANVTNVVPGVT